MLTFLRLRGNEAREFAGPLAELRLKVFWEFPYLYEGTPEYEMKYLETYFLAEHSFIFLVKDQGKVVGATTSVWAREEVESFRQPFISQGMNPDEVFYFGESVLLPEYRNRGLGKLFFTERETFARSLPFIRYSSFCAVRRPESHPLKPAGYRPLDEFWAKQGYKKIPGLVTTFSWLDRGEQQETEKQMQFWLKNLR